MARLFVFLFILSLSPLGWGADRVQESLEAIALEKAWLRVEPVEPNLYLALQPGEYKGKRDESYVSIQRHPVVANILKLKKRFEADDVKPGSAFEEWRVVSIERDDGCFKMKLKLKTGREVTQEWCFGAKDTLVITESGPRRMTENVRRRFHDVCKAGVTP